MPFEQFGCVVTYVQMMVSFSNWPTLIMSYEERGNILIVIFKSLFDFFFVVPSPIRKLCLHKNNDSFFICCCYLCLSLWNLFVWFFLLKMDSIYFLLILFLILILSNKQTNKKYTNTWKCRPYNNHFGCQTKQKWKKNSHRFNETILDEVQTKPHHNIANLRTLCDAANVQARDSKLKFYLIFRSIFHIYLYVNT